MADLQFNVIIIREIIYLFIFTVAFVTAMIMQSKNEI